MFAVPPQENFLSLVMQHLNLMVFFVVLMDGLLLVIFVLVDYFSLVIFGMVHELIVEMFLHELILILKNELDLKKLGSFGEAFQKLGNVTARKLVFEFRFCFKGCVR